MIIHPAAPNSLEWLQARVGIPTASELDQILTPNFKIRTGQMPWSYCYRKLAEKWLGSTVAGYQSIDMEIGQILEQEAIPTYEILRDEKVQRVGLVLTDDEGFGASPDGIVGDDCDCGIEIKCPRADTHVKYLLGGCVPEEHMLQVQGGLFATGFTNWIFMSYHRRMPPLIVHVTRNREMQDAIAEALTVFYEAFDDSWAHMVEINKGPPRRTSAEAREKQEKFHTTTEDVPT
jgi:hypothetical protein